jgi:beta-glucosidase-like glycosyl hydrolase
VPRSREELAACELVPFQAAIDAGCSLIMTAHVEFPAIDSSGAPATLSPILLKQLLRDEMGFEGVVCSDSLLMAGVRDRFASEEEMALATLAAGVDLLLDLREPLKVVDHLCRSVADGALSVERVDQAFRRVWRLKQRVFEGAPAPAQTPPPNADKQSILQLAARVARQAIEVSGQNASTALPFDPNVPLVAVLLKPFETAIDPPEQPLADALRSRFHEVTYLQIGPNADDTAYQLAHELTASAKQLLVAMIVRPAAWHAFGLRPNQSEFLQQVTRERNDVVLASLGVPYALNDYPSAAIRLCTYSDVPVSQDALAQFLLTGK